MSDERLCRSRGQSDVFTLRARDFASSSWLSKASIFRRENRQSHYRNDPVKYDLKESMLPREILTFWSNMMASRKRARCCSFTFLFIVAHPFIIQIWFCTKLVKCFKNELVMLAIVISVFDGQGQGLHSGAALSWIERPLMLFVGLRL